MKLLVDRVAVYLALALGVFALVLAIALPHQAGPPGPRGPAGAQGSVGKSAELARLGICWQTQDNAQLDQMSFPAIESLTIQSAVFANGVYTCPQGMTFVSVVPGPAPTTP